MATSSTDSYTCRKEQKPRPFSQDFSDPRECVRMVLVGKTGVGKSATGNTILGREAFASKSRMHSVTKKCRKETGSVGGREVAVIDTPGLYDTTLSPEDVQLEIMKCMGLASPGPHVFLLVISVGRFTQEERETLQLIKLAFGDKAEKYTMVLFTKGDDLGDQSIEEYIAEGDPEVKKLIESCVGRYHVFNNKETDKRQVIDLFKKIEIMNWDNGGSCYTCEMFLEAEMAMIRMQVTKEKEEEMKRELAKYKSEIEDQQREKRERGRNHHKRIDQDKERGELLGLQTMKAEDDEGMEGASGTWKPEHHGREDQEGGGEEQNCKQEEEESKKIMKGKGGRGSRLLGKFKSFKMNDTHGKIKEMKKKENGGVERKRHGSDNEDEKAEKPNNDESASSTEARPEVLREIHELSERQAQELKSFMTKHLDPFEALEGKKKRCVIL